MNTHNERHAVDRRTFLKVGSLGAAAVVGATVVRAEESALAATSAPTVVYRTLGRTGLKVSVVGFGTLRTSEPSVIQAAFDRGVNYVDTARSYLQGRSESVVGQALKGYRDKVLVATKVRMATPKADILASVEQSLQALQTDRIDVLQLHKPPKTEALHQDAKEALTQLRKDGKVRFFGVTTHSDEVGVIDTVLSDPDKFYDMVLVTYNFKSAPELTDAIARAAKAGLGIVAMKTQAKSGYDTKELGDISPHQAALKWVLQNPNVHTAVPGMADLAQVEENTEVMRSLALTRVDRQILERYGKAIESSYCRRCGACLATCPQGVNLVAVGRCLMYADGYGDLQLARMTHAEIAPAASTSVCRGCEACTAKCIYGLDLATRMNRARTLFA